MGIIGIINTLFLEVSEIVFKGVCRNLLSVLVPLSKIYMYH